MHGVGHRLALTGLVFMVLGGCVEGRFNKPDNHPLDSVPIVDNFARREALGTGETVIGLSFSGGGTRASALSYGVINELAGYQTVTDGVAKSMIDEVGFVSGVSGGSVLAAYFALRGADTIPLFRDEFLYKNPQSSFRTTFSLFNIMSVLGGGLNSKAGFQDWLDDNLFHDATFGDLTRDNAPVLWINASDIANNSIFTFEMETFATLCSDHGDFRLSEAVAAASAVPGIFAPIVIKNYAGTCDFAEPEWIRRALSSPDTSLVVRNHARTLRRYRNPDRIKYLKLYDGGITDNLGISGLVTQRERFESPIKPLTPQRAVALKNMLFIVVNATTKTDESFQATVEGPPGIDGIGAVLDTMMTVATARTRDSFFAAMKSWHEGLVEFRCGLTAAEVRDLLGERSDWDCEDIHLDVLDLSFDQVHDRELRARLDAIPTAYVLSREDTDLLIETGRHMLSVHPRFKEFLSRVQ
jgi:NTE family protein